ncbi:hypothetical protein K1719_006704 [Acacia pycnantha]|nr:hypothetical protein K1719_006704 [Acacia pycnantha]
MSNCRPSLSINKNSQAIVKPKPKVRIIHIIAPEIIKTDVENFRELVQRLTGKPSTEKHGQKMMTTAAASRHQDTARLNVGLSSDKPKAVMKEEEVGVCREESTSAGGYLGGFSDLEGFGSEFAQIPGFLPFDDTYSH